MKKSHVVIYQIKNVAEVDYAFRSFDRTKFRFSDYQKVYEMDVEPGFYVDILENLFSLFNRPDLRPKDFTGHSMSVSDVVVIDGKGYYCDAFAWSNMGDMNEVIKNCP